jgi:basic membrane protein A
MMKRADVAAGEVASMTAAGKFPGGQVLTFSLKNKGVGIPAGNPNLSPDILKQVAAFESQIASGKLAVSEIPKK